MGQAASLESAARRPDVDRYVVVLAAAFAALWLLLAIAPRHRADWALENALTVACVAVLAFFYQRAPLSRTSYTCIALFLSLHSLGAHYTYSEVPYDAWFRAVTGHTVTDVLGWRRNNFDRMVHFLYGALLVHPIRELVVRATGLRGFWSYFVPLDLTMSTSATYELIEWGAAVVFGGDLGAAYLGTQGDPWDAQKDMSLAALGAVLSTLAIAWMAPQHRTEARTEAPHERAGGVSATTNELSTPTGSG